MNPILRRGAALVALLSLSISMPTARAQETTPPAVAQPAPQATFEPGLPRLLVLTDSSADGLARTLSAQAASTLVQQLNERGYFVVDEEQARLRARRNQAILKSWAGRDIQPDQQLARLSYADVFVRVAFKPGRERKQQGRYAVADRLDIAMASTDDARNLLQESLRAKGTSFDGYREAHDQALAQLCGSGGTLGELIIKRLEQLHTEEIEKGSLYTIVLYVEGEVVSETAVFEEKLRSIDGIDPASLAAGNSGMVPVAGKPARAFTEFRVRYRGPGGRMRAELNRIIQELKTPSDEEKGLVLDPTFITSRRRIDILLRRRVPEATLDKEIQRKVGLLIEELYGDHKDYLAGKRLSITPASLPAAQGMKGKLDAFVRAYWRTHDQVEKRLARAADQPDPMGYGPVVVLGAEFATLAEARNRADAMAQQYYSSPAGKMAVGISNLIRSAIESTSKGATTVLAGKDEQALALDVIKYESDLYREEGAVTPETIAYFERDGAQALVIAALDTLLENYELRIVVIDLGMGATIRNQSFVQSRFKKDLDRILKG